MEEKDLDREYEKFRQRMIDNGHTFRDLIDAMNICVSLRSNGNLGCGEWLDNEYAEQQEEN